MWYECPVCRGRVRGDEGRLLQLLPDNIRQTYPVPPRYACGGYHLHKDLVDVLEASMKTYANADFVSSLLHRKQGKRYTDKCSSYLCQEVVESFCDFDDFIGSTRPPNGQSLRALYEEAEYSLLTPYGYSQVERYQRELQQVEVGESDIVAFDHTFAALKCYSDLPGAKAIFTGMKGSTQEVVSLGIVPSTSLADAAHLLQQSKLRRTLFRPSVVYTDTCPHGQEFWQTLFGHQVETKLGLFHFIHRIVDTMDNRCEFFFDAIVALKNAIYTYNASDEAALLESLKMGRSRRPSASMTMKRFINCAGASNGRLIVSLSCEKIFDHSEQHKTNLPSGLAASKANTTPRGGLCFHSRPPEQQESR